MKTLSKELIVQMIEQVIPFNAWLGMKVTSYEAGEVVTRIPFKDELIGDPFRPALHGGIIAALIDATGGAAVFTLMGLQDRASTVDFRVDFLRPGLAADLFCRAKVMRMGNRVAAVSITAFHEGCEAEPVAMGMAVYNIKRDHRSEITAK